MPLYKVLFTIHKQADGRRAFIGNLTYADHAVCAVATAWDEICARHLHDENLDLAVDVVLRVSAAQVQSVSRE